MLVCVCVRVCVCGDISAGSGMSVTDVCLYVCRFLRDNNNSVEQMRRSIAAPLLVLLLSLAAAQAAGTRYVPAVSSRTHLIPTDDLVEVPQLRIWSSVCMLKCQGELS